MKNYFLSYTIFEFFFLDIRSVLQQTIIKINKRSVTEFISANENI